MAKITSLIKFQGTLDGVTIDKDGVAKMAAKSRTITSDRTRENNAEFKTAAQQGKVIRDALSILKVGDRYLSSRMFAAVRSGVALDDTNERGKRILSNNEAKIVLPGFELNGNSNLLSVAPINIEIASAGITVSTLDGKTITPKDIYQPEGTTHVQIAAICAKLDISPDILKVKDVKSVSTPESKGKEEMVLPPLAIVADADLTIVAIAIRFYQQVNGDFYELQNGSYNVGRILEIL